jgi:hypothetical protein
VVRYAPLEGVLRGGLHSSGSWQFEFEAGCPGASPSEGRAWAGETTSSRSRFAIRVCQFYKIEHAPEAALLNSFFLGDLTRARALLHRGQAPPALRRYRGLEAPRETIDLFADRGVLEQAVAPAAMPARALAAVNLARSELAAGEGLVAVWAAGHRQDHAAVRSRRFQRCSTARWR